MMARALLSAVVLFGAPGQAPAEEPRPPGIALAQSRTAPPALGRRVGEPLPDQPDCTCRGIGRDHPVGDQVCLNSARGPRIATCDRYGNNTNWVFSDSPCVSAARPEPRRL